MKSAKLIWIRTVFNLLSKKDKNLTVYGFVDSLKISNREKTMIKNSDWLRSKFPHAFEN